MILALIIFLIFTFLLIYSFLAINQRDSKDDEKIKKEEIDDD